MTAIEKEKQHTRFKIQQLKENAEKEEMKAKVRCFCLFFFPEGVLLVILKTDF